MQTPPQTPEPKPRRRGLAVAVVGGLAALAAGLGAAWVLADGDGGARAPSADRGLVIDATKPDDGLMEPGKQLRCFVQGQYVGKFSLTECAQRNGVATDALDVGLDQTGALAAAQQAGALITPLPPIEEEPPADVEPALPPEDEYGVPAAPPTATCWRHGGGRWRRIASDTDLQACVQALFAGRCERPGGAAYGRFGQQTLRLVAGRVEVSNDNRFFRTLVPQAPDCSIPPFG